jgi:N-acetylglucosamine kinase-like BadF-type ATPase
MILIADSGSTKTAWSLVNPDNGSIETCQTSGINPMYQDEEAILKLLQQEITLHIPDGVKLFFYGAGCINNQANGIVQQALDGFFHSSAVSVETDLMAAARSLCQQAEGIACILGTGSNSCYYNGKEITRHVSPLGYMLGDEGSGAVIGRKFIADLLKNQLPKYIRDRFFSSTNFTAHQLLENVYKKPFPNRFLAQFTRFIHENMNECSLRNLVKDNFNDFFTRNIRQYPEAQHLPIQFTGSIAFYFEILLRDSANESGFRIGIITKSPMEGLIKYHLHT